MFWPKVGNFALACFGTKRLDLEKIPEEKTSLIDSNIKIMVFHSVKLKITVNRSALNLLVSVSVCPPPESRVSIQPAS